MKIYLKIKTIFFLKFYAMNLYNFYPLTFYIMHIYIYLNLYIFYRTQLNFMLQVSINKISLILSQNKEIIYPRILQMAPKGPLYSEPPIRIYLFRLPGFVRAPRY